MNKQEVILKKLDSDLCDVPGCLSRIAKRLVGGWRWYSLCKLHDDAWKKHFDSVETPEGWKSREHFMIDDFKTFLTNSAIKDE